MDLFLGIYSSPKWKFQTGALPEFLVSENRGTPINIWSNFIASFHPQMVANSKGNLLISRTSRLVKYDNLTR